MGGAQLPRDEQVESVGEMLAAAAAEGSGRARSEDNFLSEWRMRLSVGLLLGRVGLVQSSMRKLRGNVARSTTVAYRIAHDGRS